MWAGFPLRCARIRGKYGRSCGAHGDHFPPGAFSSCAPTGHATRAGPCGSNYGAHGVERAAAPGPGRDRSRLAGDLESLLAKGVRQGHFAADLDATARACELLAVLDGLSTLVVLGRHGADRDRALRMALSVTERLMERG